MSKQLSPPLSASLRITFTARIKTKRQNETGLYLPVSRDITENEKSRELNSSTVHHYYSITRLFHDFSLRREGRDKDGGSRGQRWGRKGTEMGDRVCVSRLRGRGKKTVSNQANGVCLKKSCINGHYRLTCLR